MITRRQQPVQDHVQTVGTVKRENDLLLRRSTKNRRRAKPTAVDDLLQLLASVRRSPTNRSAILAVVFVDGVVHAFGLRKARRGIVEIDCWLN